MGEGRRGGLLLLLLLLPSLLLLLPLPPWGRYLGLGQARSALSKSAAAPAPPPECPIWRLRGVLSAETFLGGSWVYSFCSGFLGRLLG